MSWVNINFSGATLSKGLNRGVGTILGGGLGCLAAALAQAVSGIDKAASIIIIGCSVFIISKILVNTGTNQLISCT